VNILVRVDSYPEIALGHLNRCIKLSASLREYGHNITFISYDDSAAKELLYETDFDCKFVPFKINDQQGRREEFSQLEIFSDSIDLVLVDSYNVDKTYFDMLYKYFPSIVYLDDLGLNFDVDLVINPSCKAIEIGYIAKRSLCGMQYVILSDEYRMGRTEVLDTKRRSILVTMGGIDHYDLSSRVIPILEKISPKIEVNIVVGPYYENIESIRIAVQKSCLKINVFKKISNIAPIILESNIALTAGGFTAYELAAMSTPAVGVALWENQYNNIECLSNQGALIPLYYCQSREFDHKLFESLSVLMSDNNLLTSMSVNARNAVDGEGANRISRKITQYYDCR